MCKNHLNEKKFHLRDFFAAHWDKYVKNPNEPILSEQFTAVNMMMACRTPRLGVEEYACESCGIMHEVYHSCGHRFCNICGYMDTQRWCDNLLTKMIDTRHHHITVMLPSEFRQLAKDNPREIYNLLFQSAAGAMKSWLKARFGLVPGIMSVLHTFGDDKKYHVHLHMVMTDGGFSKNGYYIDLKTKRWFVKYDWLCNEKFKPIFLKALKSFNKNKHLYHEYVDKQDFNDFVDEVGEKTWRMNIQDSLNDVENIVKYTCRYTRRACMSDFKIKAIEGEYISYEYKDYKNAKGKSKPPVEIMKMHYRDFFPHLLQHVPKKRFRIVRYQGIYTRPSKIPAKLKGKQVKEEPVKDYREFIKAKTGKDPFYCEYCQQDLVLVNIYFDMRKRNYRFRRSKKIPDDYLDSLTVEEAIRDFEKELA